MATRKAAGKKTAKKKAEKKAAPPAVRRAEVPAIPRDAGDALEQVPVTLSVELGRRTITLDEALTIGDQSLIELDRHVGEPVNILLNGKLFARGEVVTVSENFGVRLTEIVGEA